jgi:hypothetical protein
VTILDGGNAFSTFEPTHTDVVDISADVQYYLQSSPEIQVLVETGIIGSDEAWTNGWIFDSNLLVRMENSQKCAIVVSYGGGWTVPLDDSSAAFPVVVVDIWADPQRFEDFSPVDSVNAKRKAFLVHAAVKRALHLTQHRSNNGSPAVYFDKTRVTSSELLGEPDLQPVSDGNGARMLRARYGISTF